MSTLKRITIYIVLSFIICGLHGCMFTGLDFGGEFVVTTTDEQKSITISINTVTIDYVSLYITSNINCSDVPVYRNGQLYGHVDLSYNQTIEFMDSSVIAGNTYSYQTGGFFFPGGEIWSNIVIITIPF